MTSCLALTFHGLESQAMAMGLPVDGLGRQYTVSSALFRNAVQMVAGCFNCTVSDLSVQKSGDWTVITFDDGLVSDYEIAFPLLQEMNLAATFFVTATKVGTDGYVSPAQLREMAEGGMEIGSHGLRHSYLVSMPLDQVAKEIVDSKERLEQIVGRQVTSFAPVGGHFTSRMVHMALQAGYHTFASMIPGVSQVNKGNFILRRNHLQAHHDANYLQRLLAREKGVLIHNALRYQLLFMAKRLLGMQRYDQLKNLFVKGVSE